jgi:hypothetical protein
MATIQHENIVDPYIHEPKGVAAANDGELYVADGAGSGAWEKVNTTSLLNISVDPDENNILVADGSNGFKAVVGTAHGYTTFTDFASPYTWTYSATYTKVAATSTAGGTPTEVTEATTSKLTYTGTEDRHLHAYAIVSLKQASGADRDIRIAIAKNGTVNTSSAIIITSKTGEWHTVTVHYPLEASTNDYFEVYMQNDGGSGNVSVGTLKLYVDGHL